MSVQSGSRPLRLFKALAEADAHLLEDRRLAREVEMLRRQNEGLLARVDELTEGGGLERQLREVRAELLAARAQVERLRAERDSWRAKAEGAH